MASRMSSVPMQSVTGARLCVRLERCDRGGEQLQAVKWRHFEPSCDRHDILWSEHRPRTNRHSGFSFGLMCDLWGSRFADWGPDDVETEALRTDRRAMVKDL